MALGQVAFPLRYGRPYGAGATAFTFLLAGEEFGALLYGWSVLSGGGARFPDFVTTVLPAAYVVAAAAAGAMFAATRRRSADMWRVNTTSQLRDLEEARQRVLSELRTEAERRPISRTRQVLDERHGVGRAGSRRH